MLPDLEGKVDGMSMRAPVPDGSVVDLVVRVGRETTVDEVNGLFEELADTGPLEGILRYTTSPSSPRTSSARRTPASSTAG